MTDKSNTPPGFCPVLLRPTLLSPLRWTAVALVVWVWWFDSPGRDLNRTELNQNTEAKFQINVNKANKQELILLPGIGEKTATRILKNRAERGRFNRVKDLERVHGIGPRTIQQIKPYTVASDAELSSR